MIAARSNALMFVGALILIGIAAFCMTNVPERYNSPEKLKETFRDLVHGSHKSDPTTDSHLQIE